MIVRCDLSHVSMSRPRQSSISIAVSIKELGSGEPARCQSE